MNNKKTTIYFLPYLILLFSFAFYLISISIYLKFSKIMNPNYIFSELNQIFLLNPSYVTQLILAILCLSLLINSYFFKKHLYKRNILLDKSQIKKNVLLIFIFTFLTLLITFFINILIIFIKQNYYYMNHAKGKNQIIYISLATTKILEFLFIFSIRISYWFLLTYLFIKSTSKIQKMLIFSLILIFIYLISLTLGVFTYNIVHDHKTNYLIVVLVSLFFPETINTLYGFNQIAGMVSNVAKNTYLINLVYLPSFIVLIIVVSKIKWQKFKISINKKLRNSNLKNNENI